MGHFGVFLFFVSFNCSHDYLLTPRSVQVVNENVISLARSKLNEPWPSGHFPANVFAEGIVTSQRKLIMVSRQAVYPPGLSVGFPQNAPKR